VKRLLAALVVMALAAGLLFVLAAAYEVESLTTALGRTVRGPGGGPAGPRVAATSAPKRVESDPDGGAREKVVRFSLTEADLGRLLGRREEGLAGLLTRERAVVVRLTAGHVGITSANRLRLGGVPIARYAAGSDWSLAPRPEGLGLRLNELRVAGTAVPFAPWLLQRLSARLAGPVIGREEDGWVSVRIPRRHAVDRIEVAEGRLTVSARIR